MRDYAKQVIRQLRDAENFERALQAMSGKIQTYAQHSFSHIPGMQPQDMEQELLGVLWLAVKSYDPGKGASFNSFSQQCFRNKIGTLRREAGAQRRSAEIVSLDVEAVQVALDARRSVMSAEDHMIIRETLKEEWESAPEIVRVAVAG